MKTAKINSDRMNNFLQEHGCYPYYENSSIGYYEKTDYFNRILDLYYIQYKIMPHYL